MQLLSVLNFTHSLLDACLKPGDCALDGTAGNGHDTLKLAQLVGGTGEVWAFDVQLQALERTLQRLRQAGEAEQVRLVHAGHERLAEFVGRPLAAAVFNFGWLPGSDKSCTTQSETSLAALSAAAALLKPGGLLLAVLYPGHEAGRGEAAAAEQWASELNQQQFSVLKYGFVNQKNFPPFLLAVEKKPNTHGK